MVKAEEALRWVVVAGVLLSAAGLAACESTAGTAVPLTAAAPAPDTLGTRTLYAYRPDSTASHLIAEPLPEGLPPSLTIEAALDSLGRRLADGYFDGASSGVAFETVEVMMLPTPPEAMRLAIVNIVDPDSVVARRFSLGTSGGLLAKLMIKATLMQPPLRVGEQPPLLNGLVLLYNGRRFPYGEPEHAPLHYIQHLPAGRYIRDR